ncbi:MAG TPA: response regulator transcription factor [Kofleriaceae bacterium]|nr:response regulator transcription factor [Kofleriaceae bacterium]
MLLKKIVVAEDDDAIAHLVNMALGDAGFLCLRARDGAEALSLVRVHTPDLLILDVMMPRLSGLDVARKLKADVILSRTPILMLTALTTVDNKVEGFEAGADDYLVKPFDIRELSARVHALIRASRRERDRNPTTNLPGSSAMEDLIAAVIKGGREVAILHFDVAGFDGHADQVGFGRAEEIVAGLGQIVLECARGRAAEFVGHLGGVDFISVAASDQAEALAGEVIAAFQHKRAEWLAGQPASPGGAEPASLEMKVAVATTRGLRSEDELSVRLATTMRRSKQREGSGYVVWGPELA